MPHRRVGERLRESHVVVDRVAGRAVLLHRAVVVDPARNRWPGADLDVGVGNPARLKGIRRPDDQVRQRARIEGEALDAARRGRRQFDQRLRPAVEKDRVIARRRDFLRLVDAGAERRLVDVAPGRRVHRHDQEAAFADRPRAEELRVDEAADLRIGVIVAAELLLVPIEAVPGRVRIHRDHAVRIFRRRIVRRVTVADAAGADERVDVVQGIDRRGVVVRRGVIVRRRVVVNGRGVVVVVVVVVGRNVVVAAVAARAAPRQ